MLIDTRVSWSVLILAVLCLIFPFLADLQFPLLGVAVVRGVENIQALLLLIFAVFSYFYMQPMRLPEGSIFGSGLYCGGCFYLGVAPVGVETISLKSQKYIFVASR